MSAARRDGKAGGGDGVGELRGPVNSEGAQEKVGQGAAGVAGVAKVDKLLDVKAN